MTERIRNYQNYTLVADKIAPLDLLFFRGVDFVSRTIMKLQQMVLGDGEFSHVGLVVSRDLLPSLTFLRPGRLYVWESTASFPTSIAQFRQGAGVGYIVDQQTGTWRFGVQIRDLEDLVHAYTRDGSEIAWVPLRRNPWTRQAASEGNTVAPFISQQESIDILETLHSKYGRKGYERNCLSLFGALFPRCVSVKNSLRPLRLKGYRVFRFLPGEDTWMFCSELVARVLIAIGALPESKSAEEYSPMELLDPSICLLPPVFLM